MQKPKRNITSIQKFTLMTIASQMLKMSDVDIAEVFNTTKQNVGKILTKVKE